MTNDKENTSLTMATVVFEVIVSAILLAGIPWAFGVTKSLSSIETKVQAMQPHHAQIASLRSAVDVHESRIKRLEHNSEMRHEK